MNQFQLIVDPFSRILNVSEEISILDAILELNIEINASCGGNGTCGKCLVQCLSEEGSLSPLTDMEVKILSDFEITQGYRLACQAKIKNNAYIRLTEKILGKKATKPQILVKQNEFLLNQHPINQLKLKNSTMNSQFGIAFDLGTTTIVGYLVDLNSGKTITNDSMFNPQISIGEDVISRISYADKSNENAKRIQNIVVNAFNQIISNLLNQTKIKSSLITRIVIVGNTAMHHLFFKLPVATLGRSPYSPAIKTAFHTSNKDVNLKFLDNKTEIYFPPIIAGFIGGDTIADIIAVRQDKIISNSLMIDIGTNGEITLGSKKIGIHAVSVAAGPAFEGAQIRFGMRGETGAIERIKINPITLVPEIEVIGKTTPIGLCGSAIIDIIAEMLRAKIITRSGNFNKSLISQEFSLRIRKGAYGYEYIIHSSLLPAKFNFNLEEDHVLYRKDIEIYITQKDIREIQKAKGAFLSGVLLLLEENSLKIEDIDQILIAGAFGTYLHKENAKFIGLIPDINLDKIHQLGNAAGAGAKKLLLDKDLRNVAEQIAKEVNYFELANSSAFPRTFAESMIFPHKDLNRFPSLKDEYKDIPYR